MTTNDISMMVSDSAVEILQRLTDEWNLCHPDKIVLPALFLQDEEGDQLAPGIGFSDYASLTTEQILSSGDFKLIVAISPDKKYKLEGRLLDFDGEIFLIT